MTGWTLEYEGFDARQEGLREALCTLGNGYFATRGAACSAEADGVHYPGTYLAGGYNRLQSGIAGRTVENEDLVNLPNWLPLSLRIDDGRWFDFEDMVLHEYRQSLDLRHGLLSRWLVLEDDAGRRTRVSERRLVHIAEPHLAALEVTVHAENWSGNLVVRSALDGRVVNDGVARYRDLASRHLEPVAAEARDAETICLVARTSQSRLEVAEAARTRIFDDDGRRIETEAVVERSPNLVAQHFNVALAAGRGVRVEKAVALYTSRDRGTCECRLDACKWIHRAPSFDELCAGHSFHWDQLWSRFHLDIETTDHEQARIAMILRLHVFHLLQTSSPNTMDLDVGVPARGWHGEAYRGHVFWDELFISPLLTWRLPEITRALLMYRYRRLGEARASARQAGLRGAMFPWQSGSDGREESQRLHLNPRSGRWVPDNTHLQRHINSAIAYNVWHYYQVTGDMEFLSSYGAEMFLEIARFWASFATYDEQLGRYEILGVVGPDEFHTACPGAGRPGLDNHAYTNVMAAWVLVRARDVLQLLPEERRNELHGALGLDSAEIEHWEDVSHRLKVVFHEDGLISPFEGYSGLQEFDWDGYRREYDDIRRLDRLLEAEGDTVNRYKAAKQADVLMLLYLFSAEELTELFEWLGYPFDPAIIPRTVDYYAARTSHGSTLSRVVDSWVMARSDRERSWRLFKEALESDIADVQGGTTPEGIHLGAMAGTVDLLQRGYTGIVTRGDELWLNPCLPDEVACLRLTVRYRGHTLHLTVTHDSLLVEARASRASPISCRVDGELRALAAGESHEFDIAQTRR